MKQNGVTDDALRLYLFPYSSTHHAIAWFDRLSKNSIHTFLEMALKFLSKYFPPFKVTKLRNDISNFCQLSDESLFEAHRDMINAAAEGTFMKRRPEVCYTIMTGTPQLIGMYRLNQQVNSVTPSCETCGGLHSYYECQAAGGYTQDVYATLGTYNSGGNTYQPQGGGTRPGVDYELAKSSQPPIPYPLRLNKEKLQDKADIQIHSFLQMFKKLYFNISFAEALAHMPKFAKMVKDLLTNKEKLLELANTLLNENCSPVLLKTLPEKLKDTGRFLIPCDFYRLESCMALADLGASINLMTLSVWKKLSLPELTPTRMTLELATQTVSYPAGIADDVFLQVGKFTLPADFVIVDYDVDPRVSLILGRPFLRMAHTLVDVHGEELTLRVSDEKVVFSVESTSKYPRKHGDESIHKIDILDITCEDHFHDC
ncbi:reverse transcriptase domain-containing protein [Tanacetum coccineum]